MTPEMKALIDSTGYVARANGHMFKRKVGAAVVAFRRAGGIPTFDAINHFFLISQMIVPGSSYWNVGGGNKKGEVEADEEGLDRCGCSLFPSRAAITRWRRLFVHTTKAPATAANR